jgi:hypothetical protein
MAKRIAVRLLAYRKVGGLHFMKIGRIGLSFHVAKRVPR